MKITDLRELKTDELHAELDRLRRHLFDLRSQAVTEKLGDPTQLTKTKRDGARIFTSTTWSPSAPAGRPKIASGGRGPADGRGRWDQS